MKIKQINKNKIINILDKEGEQQDFGWRLRFIFFMSFLALYPPFSLSYSAFQSFPNYSA